MFNTELGVFHAIAKTVAPFTKNIVWLGDPFWALFALVMSDVWHWAPYMTLVFLGGLASLGLETEEAARIDGASDWQVFKDIVLPQLAPVIAVVAILKTIFALKMFDQIVTLTGGGPGTSTETLAYFVYKAAFKWYDMGYASALAYILTATLFLFAIPYMRFVIRKGGPAA
jgi:multiple sugar transport system permease protein